MKQTVRGLIISLLVFLPALEIYADGTFLELPTRPEARQGIYVVKPAKPVATVVLLPGGTGKVRLGPGGPEKEGNFLVRTRDLFVDNGLMAIVVDAPSDLLDTKKGLKGHRLTSEHLTDIRAVVDYARKQAAVPVWLVGTSRGTISATHIASSEPGLVDGIVLTATVSEATN